MYHIFRDRLVLNGERGLELSARNTRLLTKIIYFVSVT
jgi:hypothetical protein